MAVTQTPQFKKAVEDSRKLKAKPNDNELLEVWHRRIRQYAIRKTTLTLDPAVRAVQARHPGPAIRGQQGSRHVRAEGIVAADQARRHAGNMLTERRRQEKAKRGAWQKIVDAGVKPQDAQKQYVEKVNGLKEKYGYTG